MIEIYTFSSLSGCLTQRCESHAVFSVVNNWNKKKSDNFG